MLSIFSLKNAILELIFPVICLRCQKEGSYLCLNCRSLLHWIPPTCFVCKKFVPAGRKTPAGRTCKACQNKSHIYAFLSPFLYGDETVRKLIHGLKYDRIKSLDSVLAGFLAEYFDRYRIFIPKDAVFVPVPLHKKRERVRGFNQAKLIVQHLCPRLSLGHRGSLQRVKKTKPQVGLAAEERRKNMVGVFAVDRPELVKGRVIILLDDVKTTGATLEEAARVLKEAGAKRVWAITVAH